MSSHTDFLDKAREALRAAQLLIANEGHNSAANRAYYATFHAARAAIIAAGLSSPERDWSHEALPGAFAQLTRRRKVYPARLLTYLDQLRFIRGVADYRAEMVSSRTVHDAVKKAAEFVSTVEKGITP